ncbi:2-oxoglutarate oxidoreductase, beta subunit [Frankia canadensis]|uniref:2-oxoglutarate oxidoreductase, beta subunit n=1 Tax=Frankia canadensis TaxID=1836972 RepID=A0A2I2L2V0_9ACTN|nr:thiamine pyrophosphate-dependent enzyme [Frankia canadensis]SNQ52253.1 2-oxoglutarate oxidoreductase, beta subunit [Frankia canadensis]SOU59543.1 2-oxoglutarate oxidoreductase, beta subunit [Frankia canadensis]
MTRTEPPATPASPSTLPSASASTPTSTPTSTPLVLLDTDPSRPPAGAQKVASASPRLLQSTEHHFCSGCGEPVALRLLLEVLDELGVADRAIGVVGHGCYGGFVTTMDVDILQCLHGRAPSCATGIRRMRPEAVVFTIQGDGDMINEGLQEVLHTAARGENVTCVLLNNGVFGDTGGHMTAATVVGQRTKTSLEGRDPAIHGYPIAVADMIAGLSGVGYVARGAVHSGPGITTTKRMLRRAFERQLAGAGFSLVEILTMCPTGWFVPAAQGGTYSEQQLAGAYPLGELAGGGPAGQATAGGGAGGRVDAAAR